MIIAKQFYQSKDADGAASYLAKVATERWTQEQGMVDDITIVVAFLNVGGVGLDMGANRPLSGGAVPAVVPSF